MMKKLCPSLVFVASLNVQPTFGSAEVRYVSADAAGANNGTGWEHAFNDLQDALAAAQPDDEIWVAKGTYKPDRGTGDRTMSFDLKAGVALYGGFGGWETQRDERLPNSHPTILSGDLNGDDGPDFQNYAENAFHVMRAREFSTTSVVDGFTIMYGNADGPDDDARGAGILCLGANLSLINCKLQHNRADPYSSQAAGEVSFLHPRAGGAGMYADRSSALTIVDCTFADNATTGGGGGLHSSARLTQSRCRFDKNSASSGGGAYVSVNDSNPATVHACTFSQNFAEYDAGGLASYSGAERGELVIDACSFVGNRADGVGGAWYPFGTGPTIANASHFEGNSASSGGAVYGFHDEVGFVDCTFRDNEAFWGGGALHLNNSARVARCHFESNTAARYGGAIFNWGELWIRNSTFVRNSAGERGGGIYAYDGEVLSLGGFFRENHASLGGAIFIDDGGDVTVVSSRFANNYASFDGGALYNTGTLSLASCVAVGNSAYAFGGALVNAGGTSTLANCTLAHNTAYLLGGGVITTQSTSLRNCILWGNMAGSYPKLSTDQFAQIEGIHHATIQDSIVQGWDGLFAGVRTSGQDPLFVDPDGVDGQAGTADDDVRLSRDSPAINAGDPLFVPGPGDTDFAGHPRVLCGRVDIGAYEFGIGDFDCNRVVDVRDYGFCPSCMSGPGAGPYPTGCEAFDFNMDRAVDLADFARFAREFAAP